MSYKEDLIKRYQDADIIKRKGPKYPDGFKLKSGAISDIYINIRDLIKVPTLFNFTMWAMRDLITTEYKLTSGRLPSVIGIPTMGAAMAPIIAYKKSWPLAIIRQHKKDHGIGNDVEGTLSRKIIVIDDVITTGSSIIEAMEKHIEPILGTNYDLHVFVIVDRRENTDDHLRVSSLMTLGEIKRYK